MNHIVRSRTRRAIVGVALLVGPNFCKDPLENHESAMTHIFAVSS